MSERNGYDPGTPSWVDLSTPDVDASVRFYGDIFGWDVQEAGPAEETGGYRIIMRNGKPVGGMMGLMDPNQPPVWSTYVATDDADATTQRVRDAGGTVIVEPMDVMDAGRMAFFLDPGGAAIGIWQAGTNKGAGVVNEPGALVWNELQVRDPEAHKPFYKAVFDWDAAATDQGPIDYTTWNVGDTGVGGMLTMPPEVPAQVPPNWMVYFGVEDADATLARVKELGGSEVMGPIDIPIGRFAIASDPNGTPFAFIALKEWPG
jgi:uncharacterized protein